MSQNINQLLKKETCEYCSKFILVGQQSVICNKCKIIQHGKCSSKNFSYIRENWYCASCVNKYDINRYNPFLDIIDNIKHDKTYDNEPLDFVEVHENLSNILEDCRNHTRYELNHYINFNKITNQNSFSSYFLNIDGNKTNFDNLVVELQLFDTNFSVIGLAETNTNSANKDAFIINNYTSCYQDTIPNKQKGTGVALYVHNNYNFSKINEYSVCNADIETLFIEITDVTEPVTIGVVYRPPSGNLKQFNEKFQNILSQLPQTNVYIMGDYNVDLHNLKVSNSQDYEELVISSGYSPLISIATHEKPQCNATCIDNILVNNVDHIVISGTLSSIISHHRPIFQFSNLSSSNTDNKSSTNFKLYYDYSRKNLGKLCNSLKEKLTMFDPNTNEIDDFVDVFQNSVDDTCKLETPRTSKRNHVNNPWITQGLINSINRKEKLYKAWKKSITYKNKLGNVRLYSEYKSHRKILTKLIKKSKKSYHLNEFEKCNGNPKKTWEIINRLRGKTKNSQSPSFVIDNERVISRRVIANKFNNYFASLAAKMNTEAFENYTYFDESPSFEHYMPKSCEASIFLEDCAISEILEIINELSSQKASDIPILLVKSTSQIISPLLSMLYNRYMRTGIFPDCLKIGKITPIFKKGNRELIENYRPISTLPIFGKIFEKIIHKRLYNFFISKSILPKTQFGFRKGHSTSHALNYSVDIIKNAQKQKKTYNWHIYRFKQSF